MARMDSFSEALKKKRQSLLKEVTALKEKAVRVQEEASRNIDDLEAQRTRLETKLHHIEQLLVMEAPDVSVSPELASAPDEGTVAGLSETAEQPTDSSNAKEAAYQALREIGHPVYYKELALIVLRRGVMLAGKDPAATLLSHLARDDRFVRPQRRGEYGLREWYKRVRNVGQRGRRRRKGNQRRRIGSGDRGGP